MIATAIADALEEVGTDPRTMMIYAVGQSDAGKQVILQTVTERALSKLRAERKPDDPDVLTARHNIAYALLNQGKAAEAEAAFRDLLPLRERVQGPEHPGTLATRHELARALLNQGKATEAEAAIRGILSLRERVWGPEHPDTLDTRHGHACALLNQGKAAEAEAALRDLLPLRERVQGPEHPGTLVTRHELARALLAQGNSTEAEAAFRDLLPLRERVQGPEHLGTLATRRQLARATLEQGAAEQAREQLSALPDSGDQRPEAKARDAMLRGWLADLDGERPAADTLLDQAGALLSHLDPAHHMRRDLARYRETRGPDGKGGTMVAAEYTKPS